MSGVGEADSVLTLIKAAAILAEVTTRTIRKLKNAPQELNQLAAQLLVLQAELELIEYTASDSHRDLLSPGLQKQIEDALIAARDGIAKLDNICTAAQGNERFSARLHWVCCRKDQAAEIVRGLGAARDKLIVCMQLLTTRGISLTLRGLDELKAKIEHITDSDVKQHSHSGAIGSPKQDEHRRLQSPPCWLDSTWAVFGATGSLISTEQGAHKDYFMAMQIALPLDRIIGEYALVMAVSVRTFPLCPSKFRLLHGSSFGVARIVDELDPFMLACDKGDLIAVRSMLQRGEGRPTDIAARNWTPLAFAIRSGSQDVVAELLDNGADVEGTVGLLQTTPLQWAIWHKQLDVVRLLLDRGACQDRMNGYGWNSTFFCWPLLQHGERCMLDFLQVLSEDTYQDLDVADTEGWTALHRVAAFGMPSEVIPLIKLGADPEKNALPLRWTAIHHATFYGNHPVFEALLPYYGDKVVSMTDERGWTLLHIAASASYADIVQSLLRLGVDPEIRSKPFMSHMPKALYGRACTAREAAGAQSKETEGLFQAVMREHSLTKRLAEMEVEAQLDDGENFCDASETLI